MNLHKFFVGRALGFIAVIVLLFVWFLIKEIYPKGGGTIVDRILLSEVFYQCSGGETINANYYKSPDTLKVEPGQPPIPTGSVDLVLSDGRHMTLKQTISADGARYANQDESFIFWGKGDGALVFEDNQQKSYIDCVKASD